ncbi:MAG: undecaprenyl-diphosphate phosphatase [Spirochaetia bacterium]|jgi:undecaprenyl-diphosphatase
MGAIALFFQSLALGLVQGLTEFIPISSSAHLVIVPWLFGWTDPALDSLTFDVALHLGTLVAVIVFFAPDWQRLIVAWFRSIFRLKIDDNPDTLMAWWLLLACIPGAIIGVLFEGAVTASFHVMPIPRLSMVLMAAAIAALGMLLLLADRLGKVERGFSEIRFVDALLIGCAQALAIFPGVSRSGATITAGLALGLKRETAARFSFLLSAPIIAGAGLKSLYELLSGIRGGAIQSTELIIFPVGFLAAAVSGFFCIKVLLTFLQRHSTRAIVFYRWGLAALVLVVAFLRG